MIDFKGFMDANGLNQKDLASFFGVSKSYISQVVNGKAVLAPQKLSKLMENEMGWDLSMIDPSENVEDALGDAGIPLIPYDAFAGYGVMEYQDLAIEDYYHVREFQSADFLLRIKGDSMAPKYNGGDLIACKKVTDVTFWQWHRIYAICTKNQGILIKRVEQGANGKAITCVSENDHYAPFELNYDEIISVALVMGGISLE